MADGGVRDLLVQLRLDGQNFKTEMGLAKQEVSLLAAQLKGIKSDKDIADSGAMVRQNLQSQIKTVTDEIALYEERIGALKTALSSVTPGSKDESSLTKDIGKLETSLANAHNHLTNLKNTLRELNATEFVTAMQQVTNIARDADMAYSMLVGDWARETADSADEINVAREQALAMVEKIATDRPGWYEGWEKETDAFIRDLITRVPASYEEVSEAMANAMQAGGVAVEDVEEFTEAFIKLEKSTDLTGEEGARNFGKFLTVMGTEAEEYEKMSSVIVELGNNVAATESQIVDTAVRSASALKAVGFTEEDILGSSASALALGMEPAAAASSLEKLAIKFGGSAEFAKKEYAEFAAELKAAGLELTSFYDLQVAMDQDSQLRKGLLGDLGMTGTDFDRLMKNAVQAEKVAWLYGSTVAEFGKAWEADPAQMFADLFNTIGQLDETGAAGLFDVLGQLGITEIRAGRLARNFSMVNENLSKTVTLARTAGQENTALERESSRLFATTASQRQMNQNKNENYLTSIGKGVTAARQPWDNFFADLKQNLTENLPEWATTGFGAVVEILGSIGNLVSNVGGFAQGIYYTGQVYKDIKATDWGKVKGAAGTVLKTAGKFAVPAAAAMGLGLLVDYINDMATDTTAISQNLANIQINIDEDSKNATLAAIAEVKAASDQLSGEEMDAKYGQVSSIVQMGYGTSGMFGQAMQYEADKAEREIEDIYARYGATIQEVQAEMVANAGNEARLQELQSTLTLLEGSMQKDVNDAKKRYSQVVSDVVSGALRQAGLEDEAKAFGEKYNLLDDLVGLGTGAETKTANEINNMLRRLYESGVISAYDWTTKYSNTAIGSNYVQGMAKLPLEMWTKQLYESMQPEMEKLMGNSAVTNVMGTIFTDGMMESLSLTDMNSVMQGLFGAMDVQQIAQTGASNMRQIGVQSALGLGQGWSLNGDVAVGNVTATCSAMVAAAQSVLQIHSPSRVMAGIGLNMVDGLAQGVLEGRSHAVNAVRDMMLQMQAEADQLSPRINAVMAAAGSGAAYGVTGAGSRNSSASYTQNFHFTGADLSSQQGIKKLAQQIARVQRNTNASIGKS